MAAFTHQVFAIISTLIFLFVSSCHNHEKESEHDEMEAHHSEYGIFLDHEQAHEFDIQLEEVFPDTFNDIIKTSGEIQSPNSDFLTATAKKSGIITLNPEIYTGVPISKGTLIGEISSVGLQGGESKKVADLNLGSLKAEYERLKPLFEEGLITAATFREAEKAYLEAQALAGYTAPAGTSKIYAESDGSVNNVLVKTGDFVEVGAPIASIIKNNRQILKADLPIREGSHYFEIQSANIIPEGSTEALKLSEFNGERISGNSIPAADNGYLPVYFSFNGNIATAPGGFAEVFLICGQRNNVISVPREALVEIQGNKYLYVALDEENYQKRLVKTGATDGQKVEIIEGLNGGENVVVKGSSIIRMAETSSITPQSHNHSH